MSKSGKIKIEDFLSVRTVNSKGNAYGTCIKCKNQIGWKTDRVVSHIKYCENVSPDKKAAIFKSKVINTVFIQKDPASDVSHKDKQGASSQIMERFADKLTSHEVEKCDMAMAMFFYRTGTPFKLIDTPVFRDMILALRPAYSGHIKSSSTLGGNLLDKTYEKVKKPTLDMIDGKKGFAIISDGWTDVCGNHIVNFMIQVVGEAPFFLKSINTSSIRMSAVNIAEMLKDVANELGTANWIALLTDNANVMQAAAEIIEKEFPLVCCNGCCAHGLNLFLKNVCKKEEIANVLNLCNQVIKIVNNHTRLSNYYTHTIRKSLNITTGFVQSVDTRWYSQFLMSNSVLVNKIALRKLVEEDMQFLEESLPAGKRNELIDIVDSNVFWKNLKFLTEDILLPSKNAILLFEKDTTGIEFAYSTFKTLLELYGKLPDNSLITAKHASELLEQDWNFMHSESMGYAFILAPKNHNFEMVNDDFEDTLAQFGAYIELFYKDDKAKQKLAKDNLDAYFVALDQLTPDALEQVKSKPALAFWSTYGKKYEALAPIAKRILSIPCSSAASERCWNLFKRQHSIVRNRLAPETVEKLVFIQNNAHLLTPDDLNDYLSY